MILSLNHLRKSFGSHEVLKGISLEARSGAAFGLLGRNGAGKTTTIRVLMGVFPPDEGELLLDGQPLRKSGVAIGYLPEEKGLYPKQGILRQMIYIGELRGLSYRSARSASLKWLDRLGLAERARHRLDTLSKGNQQKIQLAVSLLADPPLLVLDEPFSGLDPVNALLLEEVVREQVAAGKLVFFSSHQMNYVEDFCDSLALLHGGEIVLRGSIRELRRSWPRESLGLVLKEAGRFFSPAEAGERLEKMALPVPFRLEAPRKEETVLRLEKAEDKDALLAALSASPLSVESFRVIEPSLEEIFVAYTGGAEKEVPAHV